MRRQERYYPVALNLQNRSVLVAGGGTVAERKVKILLRFGARVNIVSPDLTPALLRLFKLKKIGWAKRAFLRGDVKDASLVIAATSKAEVNKQISRYAKRKGILVNVVDNADLSNFISPAYFQAGKAVVAVNTNAEDPCLSRDLKNFLKEHWGEFLSYRNRL